MILHAEDWLAARKKTFQSIVVEVEMRQLDVGIVERSGVHCEAVIVGCDLYFLRDAIEHGMICAAVSELQLVGFSAERVAEDLMAEADTEDWGLADETAYRAGLRREHAGVAGTIRQEHAIGFEREDIVRRSEEH